MTEIYRPAASERMFGEHSAQIAPFASLGNPRYSPSPCSPPGRARTYAALPQRSVTQPAAGAPLNCAP